jgi:peroxiredoxin
MKKWLLIIGLLTAFLGCAQSSNPPLSVVMLPKYEPINMTLPELDDSRDYAYLGIPHTGGEIMLDQLRGKIIIFEIFSMYCPHCQKSALAVNELYTLIESNSETKDLIKMVGIGNRNSAFEVGIYKDKYAVPFPLVPDKELRLTQQLVVEQVGTPYFVVMYIDQDDQGYVFHTASGEFTDPALFLETIISKTKEKR